jgi:type VI secretion system secreted protein Hcp
MAGRLHRPLTIEKEIDKASPVLYKAVAEGTPLSQAILRWCRINEAGREEEYFNMTMKNVRVVSVAPKVLNIKEQESMTRNHFEMVELRYEQITWTYRDGNLMFKDEWNERW